MFLDSTSDKQKKCNCVRLGKIKQEQIAILQLQSHPPVVVVVDVEVHVTTKEAGDAPDP